MKKKPNQAKLFNSDGAEFSLCRKYRHVLWRSWDDQLPRIAFIGLNPSTADENAPDPTIGRVVEFATTWGYGGVYMLNLFTWVTAYPEELTMQDDFDANIIRIREIVEKHCKAVVFAWGAFAPARLREQAFIKMFPDALCLKHTKAGHPWHPLYVKGTTTPIKFSEWQK